MIELLNEAAQDQELATEFHLHHKESLEVVIRKSVQQIEELKAFLDPSTERETQAGYVP